MDEAYYFHQTPVALAKALISLVPLEPDDTLYEPFKGEGAFYDNFPDNHPKDWSEITQGRDYKDYTGEYDWVISNPPFRLEEGGKKTNSIWCLIDYYTQRAKKGVAFLMNDNAPSTLTPNRLAVLKERGWAIENITICNVKRWRGRYFFIVFRKGATPCMAGLLGSF
jgi:hypothetical protein